MTEITREEIEKLEQIGHAIIASIEKKYTDLKSKSDHDIAQANALYEAFRNMVNEMNREEI